MPLSEEENEAGRLLYLSSIGDEAAFTELATRFRGLMKSSARRVLPNCMSGDVEDAVQDSLVVIWQHCREYRIEHPLAFLCGVAKNCARNIQNRRYAERRGGRHPERHYLDYCGRVHGVYSYRHGQSDLFAPERMPDVDPLRKLGMVTRLVAQVPPVFVGVLDRYFFQGRDERDIAVERGDTPNGVLRTLHEGLECFRHLLKKQDLTEVNLADDEEEPAYA